MIASPNPWFYRGWLSVHSIRCLEVSAVWCWTSAMVLSCYEIFAGEQAIAILVLIVGSLAALIVSTLFSLLIYPALQGLVQELLRNTTSLSQAFIPMILLQQGVLFGAIYFLLYEDIEGGNFEIIGFWILVQAHAAWHLYRYMRGMWKDWAGPLPFSGVLIPVKE